MAGPPFDSGNSTQSLPRRPRTSVLTSTLALVTLAVLLVGALPIGADSSNAASLASGSAVQDRQSPASFSAERETDGAGPSVRSPGCLETGLTCPAATASAQAVWSQLQPPVSPAPREGAGTAYDAADGYVVLYGGFLGTRVTSPTTVGNICDDQTWTFEGRSWTQLEISGPPGLCYPSMTYDASDGYVLLWGGVETGSSGYGPDSGQTWTYVHGQWSDLNIRGPPANGSTTSPMTYDPSIGRVVMFVNYPCNGCDQAGTENQTWVYSGGAWAQLSVGVEPTPGWGGGSYSITYDSADGYVLILGLGGPSTRQYGQNQTTQTSPVDINGAWEFTGSSWERAAPLPFNFDVGGSGPPSGDIAYDPAIGRTVVFGSMTQNWRYGTDQTIPNLNATWTYIDDQWENATGPEPPIIGDDALAFDAADGYVLLFGGFGPGGPNSTLLNDTWIYSTPPFALEVNLTVSRQAVCALQPSGCAQAPTVTTLTVGITAVQPTQDISYGRDAGSGTVTYGPYYWISRLNFSLQLWRNVSFLSPLDASSSCGHLDGSAAACPASPSAESAGNLGPVFTWTWLTGSNDDFGVQVGDWWTLGLPIEVVNAPPYGWIPAEECSTGKCLADEAAVSELSSSALVFSPWDNASMVRDSTPLAEIDVLPPGTSQTNPPTNAPPPPPPSAPTHVPRPVTVPTPVSLPSPVLAALTGSAPTISLAAAAAGILSAGFARAVLQRRAIAQRQAVGNAVKPRRSAFDEETPLDPDTGRFE
jgi:hypothetical protein